MKTIWKYTLKEQNVTLELPIGATILHVASQRDQICFWAMVEDSNPLQKRTFCFYGTGWKIYSDPGKYLGSALLYNGGEVYHVFEEIN